MDKKKKKTNKNKPKKSQISDKMEMKKAIEYYKEKLKNEAKN